MSTLLPQAEGVDQFTQNGTALSHEQRLARAKRKGVCPRCGIKTHNMLFTRRTPVTDEHVHQGHCIKCDPDMVPLSVCMEWEQRNPDSIAWAKRTKLHTHRGVHRQQQITKGGGGDGGTRRVSSASNSHSPMKNGSGRTGKTDRYSSDEDHSAGAHERPPSNNNDGLVGKDPPQSNKTTPADDRCHRCGIQTHEKIKVKSSGFLKKSKTELRPVTLEGAVLAGRCLLCFPIPTNTNHDDSPGEVGATSPTVPPPLLVTTSSHTTGYSPRAVADIDRVNRRISAPESPESAKMPLPPQPPKLNAPDHDHNTNDWTKDVPSPTFQTVMDALVHAAQDSLPKEQIQQQDPEAWPPRRESSDSLAPQRDDDNEGAHLPPPLAVDQQGPPKQEASTVNEEALMEKSISGTLVGGVPASISIQPSAMDEQDNYRPSNNTAPPPEHDVTDRPPKELNGPLTPLTAPIDPPGDPPEEVWPLPWPLNKGPDSENEEGSDDDAKTNHSFSDMSSAHYSAIDKTSPGQRLQSTGSVGLSSYQASNSFAGSRMGSSRQLNASNSFAGSRMSSRRQLNASNSFAGSRMDSSRQLNAGNSFAGSRMDSSRQLNAGNSFAGSSIQYNDSAMSNSQMQPSKTSQAFSSSNSLMAEMMATRDLASWLQDFATEARESDEFRAEAAERGGIVAVIAGMKLQKTDGNVQQQGCIALHALAREHGTTIAKNGGIYALLSAIKHHGQHDPILQEHATGALVYVAVNDGYKLAVAKKGGIPCILAAMRRYIDNVGVQKRSCMALLKLSSHRDIIDSLANPKHRGIHIVVQSMKHHREDLSVSQYASGILKNVAQKESVCSTIVNEGGVSALIDAMKWHAANIILNQQASWALFEISSGENSIAKHGTIGSVISAMRAHSRDETIQQYGCGVVANLSITKENIYAVAKLQGIMPILDAMSKHLGNAALQRYACRAIKHLSLSSTNERAIGKKGGIISLVNTMRAHKMDGTVQREAVGALRNLTLSDENKGRIKKEDIGALFDAIKHNTHDTGLQEKAAGALLNLSSCPEVRGSIDSEWIAGCIAMMRHQSSSAKVQELLCGALKNLAISPELKKTIAQSEGINTILAAMKRHSGDIKMLSYALGALKNLSGNTENRQVIAKQKGIIAVLSSMKQHVSVATVQQEGSMVLLNLSVLKENSIAIGKHGGCAAIIMAMKQHPQSSGVQSTACAALWNLSVIPDNQNFIFKGSGISRIITGLKDHVNVPAVCHKACLALSNMAVTGASRGSIAEQGGVEAVRDAMKCHVRDASCQKYACKFLVAMLDGGDAYKREVSKCVSPVKVALKYHSGNADVKKYAHKIIVAVSFDDDAGDCVPGRQNDITSIEV